MKLLRAFILISVVLGLASRSGAQEVFGTGSRFQSLADASCGLSGHWSVFGNQAGLASIKHPALAGSFQNRFLVNELSSRTGLWAFPVQSNVFAVSYAQFGKIPFRQEKLGIAYARNVGSKLRFGVQFNRYGLYLPEENQSENTYGLEIGVQYVPTGKFTLGLHVTNPYQTGIKLSSETYRYDSKIGIGTFYQVSEAFGWVTELDNYWDDRFVLKSGFEFELLDKVVIRAGVAGKPYQLSAGFGFRVRKAVFDLGTSYHPYLGNSPSVSFQYQF